MPSGMPVDCCHYGVIALDHDGVEICRTWYLGDAEFIAACSPELYTELYEAKKKAEAQLEKCAIAANSYADAIALGEPFGDAMKAVLVCRQALDDMIDQWTAAETKRKLAESRLASLLKPVDGIADGCEYCGSLATDHNHANGRRCCGDCCGMHGSLAHADKHAYEWVRQVVDSKNAYIDTLLAAYNVMRERVERQRQHLMDCINLLQHDDDCALGAYKQGCDACEFEKVIRAALAPQPEDADGQR